MYVEGQDFCNVTIFLGHQKYEFTFTIRYCSTIGENVLNIVIHLISLVFVSVTSSNILQYKHNLSDLLINGVRPVRQGSHPLMSYIILRHI